MKTELICCLCASGWVLGALFFWALCAVGGRADDAMERMRDTDVLTITQDGKTVGGNVSPSHQLHVR